MKELFAFMAHAEDLQKIADQSQKDLQELIVTGRLKINTEVKELEKVIKTIPEIAQKATKEVFVLEAIAPLQRARSELTSTVESLKLNIRTVLVVPVVICIVCCIVMFGFASFGMSLLKSEREDLKAEIASLDFELSKKANVTTVSGQKGYYVNIDPSREILKLESGETVAKLPMR